MLPYIHTQASCTVILILPGLNIRTGNKREVKGKFSQEKELRTKEELILFNMIPNVTTKRKETMKFCKTVRISVRNASEIPS